MQDLRFALRTLAKKPGFTLVVVLVLALGIGAGGTVGSVVQALLLRPLPYAAPGRLATLWVRWANFPKTWLSVAEFRAFAEAGCFAGLGLYDPGKVNLTGNAEPERVGSAEVSANLFDVLGVKPILGRAFTDGEVREQPAKVVILSEGLWRRRFGADRGILGAAVSVNGTPNTVVGVMPAGFKLPSDYGSQAPSVIWLPLSENLRGPYSFPPRGGAHGFSAVGRLRAGVSLSQARARLRGVADGLTTNGTYPRDYHFEPLLIPLLEDVLGPMHKALVALSGAVGFVLLIACANVANLLLVRGMQRRRELAVRTALGAAPGRLVRQMLTESAVLSLLGGGVGLWLSYVAVRALVHFNPADIPRVGEVRVDWATVAFIALLSLLCSLIVGLAPVLQLSRRDLQENLKEGSRSATGPGARGGRVQSLIVVTEVALAVVLLMGANLMIRTFWALSRVDPGFRADYVLTASVSPGYVKYRTPAELSRFYDQILDSVRQIPGVQAAGAVRALPLATELGDWTLQVDGYAPPTGEPLRADWQVVSPGYFEAMRIPLRQGRLLTAADRRETQLVMVVSEAMARTLWPGKDPIGRRIRLEGGGGQGAPWCTVVGVVGDVRHDGLTAQVKQTWYMPYSQYDLSIGFPVYEMTLVVRTAKDPSSLSRPLREAIRRVDPQLPISDARSLEAVVAGATSRQRFTMFFLVISSTLALTLAAVGVYGVVRFRVSTQTREIGLRMALGAHAAQVVWQVVSAGMGLVAAGLAIGIAAALALTRSLESLLYGVGAGDSLTAVAAAAILGLVALGAIYVPARRAAMVDPVVVLREQ
jgi:putative ABC transport system permease protein